MCYAVPMDKDETWWTVDEIAARLKVHEQTVRRWLRRGALRGYLLSDQAGWRVRERDLLAYLAATVNRREGGDG